MSHELDQELQSEFLEEIYAEEYVDDLGLDEFLSQGIDPVSPTYAKPGSEEKVLVLSARYAAGMPLWHNGDCYDHGPGAAAGLFGEDPELGDDELEEVEIDE